MLYNLLLRSAWKTVKQLSLDQQNIGALPGMISVLHTFGSDIKYHLHCHCLITFGGLKDGHWVWPKKKRKIASFRSMCSVFRKIFIAELKELKKRGKIEIKDEEFESLLGEISKKRWNVRSSRPTMATETIERYLARYINRVAISPNRLRMIDQNKRVRIIYKDYRNQKPNKAAPKATKNLDPLIAINQIIQHLVPAYFQKTRYYGLHSSATYNAIKTMIPLSIIRNPTSVRTIFQILHHLLGLDFLKCEKCTSSNLISIPIYSDPGYISKIISASRAPPLINIKLVP